MQAPYPYGMYAAKSRVAHACTPQQIRKLSGLHQQPLCSSCLQNGCQAVAHQAYLLVPLHQALSIRLKPQQPIHLVY